MRILITRSIVRSYLLHRESLQGTLATYLFNKIQREPQLQGFLTATAFQDIATVVGQLKQTQAQIDTLNYLLNQTLTLLSIDQSEDVAIKLITEEEEELFCAVQNGLDALVTHDPSQYRSIDGLSVFTISELLDYYRRSKLTRSYLSQKAESEKLLLIDGNVPAFVSGSISAIFYELFCDLRQNIGEQPHSFDTQTIAVEAGTVRFGNEGRSLTPSETPQHYEDDLFSSTLNWKQSAKQPQDGGDPAHQPVPQPDPNSAVAPNLDLLQSKQREAFFKENITPFLLLILVLIGLELTDRRIVSGIIAHYSNFKETLSSVDSVSIQDSQTALVELTHSLQTLVWVMMAKGWQGSLPDFESNISQLLRLENHSFSWVDFLLAVQTIFKIDSTGLKSFLNLASDVQNAYVDVLSTLDRAFEGDIETLLLELQKTKLPTRSTITTNSQTNSGDNYSTENSNQIDLEQNIISALLANDRENSSVDEATYVGFGENSIVQFSDGYAQSTGRSGEFRGDSQEDTTLSESETIGDESVSAEGNNIFGTPDIFETLIGRQLGSRGFSVSGTNGDNQLIMDLTDLSNGPSNGYILGLAGNDTIVAGAGNDFLDGGSGTNRLTGNQGADTFIVNNGVSTITDFNADEGDRVSLLGELKTVSIVTDYESGHSTSLDEFESSDYFLVDSGPNATLRVGSQTIASLLGVGVGDTLAVFENTSVHDLEFTFSKVNTPLIGSHGDDWLVGNQASDFLMGGKGDDVLNGGKADFVAEFNVLTGGRGADIFVLGDLKHGVYHTAGGFATITDFSAVEGDKIRLVGTSDMYTLRTEGSHTEIYQKFLGGSPTIIGRVENTTNLSLQQDVIYSTARSS